MREPGQLDSYGQLTRIEYRCDRCGLVSRVPPDTPRVFCRCGSGRQALAAGVGTELLKILGCGCAFNFDRLNEWGPEKCLAELESIVAELVNVSAKHKEPISKEAAERMLWMAIERSVAIAEIVQLRADQGQISQHEKTPSGDQ